MEQGIFLETMTKAELQAEMKSLHDRFDKLERLLVLNVREKFTLAELARIKGYSKNHLRTIIADEKIPVSYEGREIVIAREDAALIKPKSTRIADAQLN